MTLVRLYIFAFLAALSLSVGGALPDAAHAKPAAAKTAKGKAAKKPAAGKGKASAAAKGKAAKGKDAKAGKAVKGGKDAKATKPVAKDAKGKIGKGKDTAAEKPGIKGKKSLKPPKPQPAKGKFAAKPAPVEDLDEEFEGEEEEAETSSGPWLIVFVLFVLVCVGVFVYMKKKNAAQGAREDFHYQSSPEQAFGSNLSSLDLDKKKKDKNGLGSSEDTDPNGTGGGGGGKKKTSWKDSLLGKIKSAGSGIKDKAKGAAAQAAKSAASNVAGELAGGLGGGLAESVGGAIGGDAVGGLAGDLAANAAGNAASKAVSKKLDKKLAKPAAAGADAPVEHNSGSSGGAVAGGAVAVGAASLPTPGSKTAHAEQSVHLMNAEAAAHAPGASFDNDASADQYGAGSFDEDRPLTAAEWCGWDKLDPEEFWYRIYDVEAGGIESDEAFERRMTKYGFKGKSHFDRVKEAYLAKTPAAHETQVMMNARMRQGKEAMQASAAQNAHLFEPIEGVSLETYAKIMSKKGRLTTNDQAAVEAIYKEFGVTTAQFDKANAGWQDRMSNQKDPATIGALMGEYSKHFAAGSSGKFAGAANAGAAMTDRNNVAGIGHDPAASEPCTLERYIEIQSAQKIWAEQGQDIGANFQKFFGISIMDFSDLGQYWSPRIHANTEWITSGKVQKLMDKYESMYRSKAA